MSTSPVSATPAAPPPARRPSGRLVVAAATIGNAMEWFDMAIYAMFAGVIARQFFASSDPALALVATWATFGVSFLIRPLGAVVLGSYADRRGRKAALVLTIRLMVVGTAMIAVLPTYDAIGVAAPMLLLLARLVQGFSAGGEFGAATAYLVEAGTRNRGLRGSFQFASQGLATLMAATFATVLTGTLDQDSLDSWGWRVPFFFGLLVGPLGWFLRRHVPESPELVREPSARTPLRELLSSQKAGLLIAVGLIAVSTSLNFVIQYMPTYAIGTLGVPDTIAFASTMLTGAILTFLTPWIGHLSDRVGRVRLMLPAAGGIFVAVVPLFVLANAVPEFAVLAGVMIALGVLKAWYFGALPTLMADCFPPATRASGLSISYNVGVAAFGGFTPLVVAWLTDSTGSPLAPGWYLMVLAMVSAGALLAARTREHRYS
ncbi:MFS transporter [Kineococcus sp. SYSU DK018]|uniref:MFS transporter n=1 Tax=Kineococcus sp. SYSU DK018 TaxID=3383139 RepID=UPI003D7C8606